MSHDISWYGVPVWMKREKQAGSHHSPLPVSWLQMGHVTCYLSFLPPCLPCCDDGVLTNWAKKICPLSSCFLSGILVTAMGEETYTIFKGDKINMPESICTLCSWQCQEMTVAHTSLNCGSVVVWVSQCVISYLEERGPVLCGVFSTVTVSLSCH